MTRAELIEKLIAVPEGTIGGGLNALCEGMWGLLEGPTGRPSEWALRPYRSIHPAGDRGICLPAGKPYLYTPANGGEAFMVRPTKVFRIFDRDWFEG